MPVVVLVLREPDLGTASVIALTAFTLFFLAGADLLHLVALAVTAVPAVTVLFLRDYQMDRINAWLDPFGQARQPTAITPSRVSGPGAGRSRRRRARREPPGRRLFLPNASNDFIFAIIGEEFGLLGGLLVIGLFLVFGYLGIRTALGAPDTFGALLAGGITSWICFQAFINVAVVVGIIPVTGIPLPFVSAGGSSLIISFAAVGILLSVSRETVEKGSWNDAPADRGRGNGRAYLPGPRRRPVASRTTRRRLTALTWPGSGGHRGLEASVVPRAGIPLRLLWLRSLRSAGRDAHLVLDPLRLLLSIPQAIVLLVARRPAAVFTTGGYVAIPVLVASAVLRIPTVLWEGNAIPGRSVRLVARLATVLAVTHAETAATLDHPRAYVTGTPIRSHAGVDPDEARSMFGGRPGERILLVFGGSQAVRRINEAVLGALPGLVERVRVIHVTGEDGYSAALAAREALPSGLRDRYQPRPFLHDDMTAALAAADLAVGRAGASTLAEAAAFALPMAIVPYPHAAGHQRRNAELHATRAQPC